MNRRPLHPIVRDVGLLVARVGVGAAFAAHGWQKLVTKGLDATTAGMADMGIPAPRFAATFAGFVELFGGVALALGAVTVLAGILLAVVMTGAFLFVHKFNGPFVSEGGWELVVALGSSALFIAAAGAGRLSVDHLVGRLRRPTSEVVIDEDVDVDVRAGAREMASATRPAGPETRR